MKRFCRYILVVLIFAFSNVYGQEITGIVLDNSSKEPLIGVNIILNENGVASSDVNGNFNAIWFFDGTGFTCIPLNTET